MGNALGLPFIPFGRITRIRGAASNFKDQDWDLVSSCRAYNRGQGVPYETQMAGNRCGIGGIQRGAMDTGSDAGANAGPSKPSSRSG